MNALVSTLRALAIGTIALPASRAIPPGGCEHRAAIRNARTARPSRSADMRVYPAGRFCYTGFMKIGIPPIAAHCALSMLPIPRLRPPQP